MTRKISKRFGKFYSGLVCFRNFRMRFSKFHSAWSGQARGLIDRIFIGFAFSTHAEMAHFCGPAASGY